MNPVGASRTSMNPSRSIESSTLASPCSAGIHRIALVERLEARPRRALGHAARRPGLALQRIDPRGDVAVGEQEPEGRLRAEADIGIDEEQMGEVRIGEEDGDAIVAAAGDEAVAPPQVELERKSFARAGPLEGEDPERIVETDHPAIAGRGHKRQKRFQCRNGRASAWRASL